LTGYQEGRIQRTIDHTTVKAGAGKAIVRPADVDLYQLVPTGEQAPDLSLLPVPAQAELTVELARLVPGGAAEEGAAAGAARRRGDLPRRRASDGVPAGPGASGAGAPCPATGPAVPFR
jgi:hypothetical protein